MSSAGIDPPRLVLEMTGNLLIEDSDRAMKVLSDLRRFGVRIAVDDFGTGYSSLSYLTRLPIDIVKIDQSLIAGIAGGPEAVVVSAVTNLAHELGMIVVVEGIENQAQHDADQRLSTSSDDAHSTYHMDIQLSENVECTQKRLGPYAGKAKSYLANARNARNIFAQQRRKTTTKIIDRKLRHMGVKSTQKTMTSGPILQPSGGGGRLGPQRIISYPQKRIHLRRH